MRFCRKTVGYLFRACLTVIVFIISSVLIQSFLIPKQLKLSPGQKMVLSVNFPLGFQMNRPQSNPQARPEITRNLVLNTGQSQKYQVLLKLFGRIPIKKLQVEVANPTMIIPGGQSIGVVFSSQGVVVVGTLPVIDVSRVRRFPAREAGIKPGDILLAINNIPINHVEEVEYFLRNYTKKEQKLRLIIKRNNQLKNLEIRPVLTVKDGGKRYMLGIFVDDPAAGVGTLSFYDPETLWFAGLGHRIAKIGGRNGIDFNQGEIVMANINGIRRGLPGKPGEKIGIFQGTQIAVGQIKKNTRFGIYGTLKKAFFNFGTTPIPAAFNSQVNVGNAEIYTVLKGSRIGKYKVKIIKVFRQHSPRDKGMVIKVTDPVLLRETGGIIQGMSGSPIIQNGRLVGAVTHVFVNDPTKGYGVLAEWMLKEMQNQAKTAKKAS
ncbi:MAG TPA: SpoIVB peptidase [Bacillota bacterium]